MTRKAIVTSTLILLFSSELIFAQINPGLIKRVAYNFLTETQYNSAGNKTGEIKLSDPVPLFNNNIFLLQNEQGGYVLISGTTKSIPVLAYSFTSAFPVTEGLPCNLSYWLSRYDEQIEYLINHEDDLHTTNHLWEKYGSTEFIPREQQLNTQVEPLITSKWNQPWPYNGMCPADPQGSHGHCVTGCVATAMGQLLYYYRFPEHGLGEYAYYHPDYDTISANFDTTYYRWNEMTGSANTKNDAIAELLFHQGVSVDMDYGPQSSGMWNHKAAYSLRNHFRYGPETVYYFRDSITLDWDSILIANLYQRKPMYYAGWAAVNSESGHAFVCDGYDGADYFHFNWGWGGSFDGYFYPENLTPGGSNFNYAQEVIPMFPDTLLNDYPGYCSGTDTLTAMQGSIEDGSGWYNYKSGANCSWLIAPHDDEYDSIAGVEIRFQKLNTETDTDIINIYNGNSPEAPLLGSYSGNSLPAVFTSTSDEVFVEFSSNDNTNGEGWLIDYEAKLPVYCSGQIFLTEPSGIVSDGSESYNYQNKAACRWRIQPPGADSIALQFLEFSTADSNDYVSVIDINQGLLLGKYSGNQLPPALMATGKVMIIFMSNEATSAEGWKLTYHSLFTDAAPLVQADRLICYPNPAIDHVNIEFHSETKENALLQVFQFNGILESEKQIKLLPGKNKFELNLTKNSTVAHFLILKTQNEIFRKIIILN